MEGAVQKMTAQLNVMVAQALFLKISVSVSVTTLFQLPKFVTQNVNKVHCKLHSQVKVKSEFMTQLTRMRH